MLQCSGTSLTIKTEFSTFPCQVVPADRVHARTASNFCRDPPLERKYATKGNWVLHFRIAQLQVALLRKQRASNLASYKAEWVLRYCISNSENSHLFMSNGNPRIGARQASKTWRSYKIKRKYAKSHCKLSWKLSMPLSGQHDLSLSRLMPRIHTAHYTRFKSILMKSEIFILFVILDTVIGIPMLKISRR